jgi:hypothetical protein
VQAATSKKRQKSGKLQSQAQFSKKWLLASKPKSQKSTKMSQKRAIKAKK